MKVIIEKIDEVTLLKLICHNKSKGGCMEKIDSSCN